ncbi:MAG TPA: hypothetical protein VK442_11035 [Xanthobacteraceae bacterium]|nr:hypothetical protein [Xanthobacteraceae bacterium]
MDTPQEAKADAVSPDDSPAIASEMAQHPADAAAPAAANAAEAAAAPAASEIVAEATQQAAVEPAAAASAAAVPEPARSSRFALLAAALAIAAALGSIVGALSASGLAHLWPAHAAPKSAAAEGNTMQAIKAGLAELAALKASLDGAARSANGQFAKMSERLDRIEHAQGDPAAKLAHMAEAIDRLEKKSVTAAAPAAPETTGAIGSNQPAAPGAAKLPDKVLPDWVVQDVRRGRALVENRFGAMFAVTPGSVIPGLGVVESVKRQDGQWVVVTARGIITEH